MLSFYKNINTHTHKDTHALSTHQWHSETIRCWEVRATGRHTFITAAVRASTNGFFHALNSTLGLH